MKEHINHKECTKWISWWNILSYGLCYKIQAKWGNKRAGIKVTTLTFPNKKRSQNQTKLHASCQVGTYALRQKEWA